MFQAIQTRYKGCFFRSRIEARWAVVWDAMGLQWEYEKEGYDFGGVYYLPDFWLPEKNCWVEIKGDGERIASRDHSRINDDLRKCMLLAQNLKQNVLWLSGQIPDLKYDLRKHGWSRAHDDFYCLEYQKVIWLEVTPQFDYDRTGFTGLNPFLHELKWLHNVRALNAGRSARFEHGESPR